MSRITDQLVQGHKLPIFEAVEPPFKTSIPLPIRYRVPVCVILSKVILMVEAESQERRRNSSTLKRSLSPPLMGRARLQGYQLTGLGL